MTRIIGGSAGGRQLRTPPGERTRPTADRVREALFSSLESSLGGLSGAAFLDLYAGSGAVGLEAASRGAEQVTLVESHQPTARLIKANARTLGVQAEVIAASVPTVLARPAAHAFDVAFIDPPYDRDIDDDLVLLQRNGWLAVHALVVVERSARSVEPSWPEQWVLQRSKKYGETVLWYVSAAPTQQPTDQERSCVEPSAPGPSTQ